MEQMFDRRWTGYAKKLDDFALQQRILSRIPSPEDFKPHDIYERMGDVQDSLRVLDFGCGMGKIPGIEIRFTGGTLQIEQLPDFYRSIDYLLVLSENEWGPLPVLEALAMGKPVIAPDVGWCWDYPVIRYAGIEAFSYILKGLVVREIDQESAQIRRVIDKALSTKGNVYGVGTL